MHSFRFWPLMLLLVLSLLPLPAAAQAADPIITHGPITGEVTADSAVLWARGSAAGTLTFEVADNADFAGDLITATDLIDAQSDFTGEVRIQGLMPNTAYTYRVRLGDGEAKTATFRTAPASDDPAALRFVFGACLGGQGYCRKPDSGWTIFDVMAAQEPDFFLFTGDTIYADSACPSDEGQNVPGAEGPFTDLEGFRSRYRYHLEDPIYANFLAQTPVYVTWDDHEILDNFSGQTLRALNPDLFAEGQQAFFEYWPLLRYDPAYIYRQVSYGAHADFFILDTRSYRDPIVNWDPSPVTMQPKTMLGAEQMAWLQAALAESAATWKFIVTSVPLAYPTGFPQPQVDGRDGWANGADRSGYETELMALLFYIERHDIDNVVFLAGDTHWPYAIGYDPDRDGRMNFYEFGSSPISALPLAPPAQIDMTFNPTVFYAEGEFMGDLFNFGAVQVAANGELQFIVLDGTGTTRYTITVQP